MMGEGVITPQYPQKIKFNIKCVTSRKEERNLNIPDVRLRYCVGSSSCVLVRVILACSSSHVRGRRRSLAWIFRDSVKKEFVCRREKIKEIEINFFFSFFDWLDLIFVDWLTCIRIQCYRRSRPNPFLVEILGSEGSGAAARRELTFSAGPWNRVDDTGGGDRMGERRFTAPYFSFFF